MWWGVGVWCRDQEFVRFKDFSLFNMFMTRPDPEYDIAFLLFDRRKQVSQPPPIPPISRTDQPARYPPV